MEKISTITPLSGPNDITYVWKLDNPTNSIPAPYFSLRSVIISGKPPTIYNIGWAINSTTPASSFTFNPSTFIRTDDSNNPKPYDSAIPPLPGLYNLVINKGSGGKTKNTIVGTINLQGNKILPNSGTERTRFVCGFKSTTDPIVSQTYYANYNNPDGTVDDTPYALNEIKSKNSFSFSIINTEITKLGTYTVFYYKLGEKVTIDTFIIKYFQLKHVHKLKHKLYVLINCV